MNKLFFITLVVGGLLLLDSPEAAASDEMRRQYQSRSYHYSGRHRYEPYRHRSYRRHYYSERLARAHHMPYWLQHKNSFGHWYGGSLYRRDVYLSWQQLFAIYLWETSRYRHHGH